SSAGPDGVCASCARCGAGWGSAFVEGMSQSWLVQNKSPGTAVPGLSRIAVSAELLQQQVRFPADALSAGTELFESAILNLTNALLADAEQVPDLPQAVRSIAGEAETQVENLALARPQVFHQEAQRLLTFRALLKRGALVVGHRLGQLEIAVVIENGV